MKEETYTSTGLKILHHPDALRLAQKKMAKPISLQISPTSRCNLSCVFCSNVNRGKDEQLPFDVIKTLLRRLCYLGAKTVEWTGGGDPTLYPEINEVIDIAYSMGLKQGFITNGVAVAKNLKRTSLKHLHWLRISLNCLDYVDDIEIPKIKGTLGFSYVMNTETCPNTIKKLIEYGKKHKPAYIRIVPNCLATDEEQLYNNKVLSEMVDDWGHPFFYQAKLFERPERCWWGYFKPFVLHDGWVYRCSSVVLNLDAERKFDEKYRWCTVEELPDMYLSKMIPFDPEPCSHCVFSNQNNLIDGVVNPNGQEDFI